MARIAQANATRILPRFASVFAFGSDFVLQFPVNERRFLCTASASLAYLRACHWEVHVRECAPAFRPTFFCA